MCVFPIYAHQACELLIIISKYNNIICQWMASSHIRNSHLGSYRASIQPSPHTHTPNRIWFAFGTISNVSFDAKQHIHLSNVWFFCIHLDQMTHRRIISSVWLYLFIFHSNWNIYCHFWESDVPSLLSFCLRMCVSHVDISKAFKTFNTYQLINVVRVERCQTMELTVTMPKCLRFAWRIACYHFCSFNSIFSCVLIFFFFLPILHILTISVQTIGYDIFASFFFRY